MPTPTANTRPESWDAIVVGSGLGGLSAAAYLAAAGRRTLLLERYDVLGGSSHVFRRKREWEFDVGVHYIGDCGPGGMVPTLLHGLGLDRQIEFLPLAKDGFDTIIGPDFELKVPSDWDQFLANLIAAFPKEERGLRRYIGVLRSIGEKIDGSRTPASKAGIVRLVRDTGLNAAWLMAPLGGLMIACGLSAKAMLTLSVQSGALGITPDVEPVVAQAGFLQNVVGDGAWYPRGGGQMFAAGFSDVMRTHGGEVRTQAEVAKIVVESGRVAGVRLADGEELRAPIVISDADIKRTYRDLVGYEHLPRHLTWRNERWKMARPLINGFFGVEIDLRDTPNSNYYVIPSWDDAQSRLRLLGMTRDLLSRADRRGSEEWAADYARRQPAFVQCSTRRDPDNARSAPAGCSAIEAQTLAPPTPELWGFAEGEITNGRYRRQDAYREVKETVIDGLLDRVDRAYPGARAKVRLGELGTPATQERYTHSTNGTAFGLEVRIDQYGPFRPGTRTPIDGLLLAGTSTAWGPGTEGSMISGLYAAGAAIGRDLEGEVRDGAIIADRSRLTVREPGFDPLAVCRRLSKGSAAIHAAKDDVDAAPVAIGSRV